MSIFLVDSIGHSRQKKVYTYMCPITNCFRDRAVSLYRSLNLAPNILLHFRHTAPLYEACESVFGVSWFL